MIDLNVEEMMETSDPLADIPSDGEAYTGESDERVEEPAESPTEKENEESPSQEGEEVKEEEEAKAEPKAEDTPDVKEEIPFHKHPRWIAKDEKIQSLEAKLEELAPLAAKVTELETKVSEKSTEVPTEFKKVFGDDVVSYNNYMELTALQQAKTEENILAKIEQSRKAEADAATAQSEAIQKNIEKIEDTYNVKLPDNSSLRNEYIKFLWEYQPTSVDAAGKSNIDFIKGWDLFQKTRETSDKSSEARKKVVAKTTTDRKAEPVESDTYELGDFLPNQFK